MLKGPNRGTQVQKNSASSGGIQNIDNEQASQPVQPVQRVSERDAAWKKRVAEINEKVRK